MQTTEAPVWVQEYVNACNRHDSAAVVAMMSEEIEVVDTAFGGVFKGRRAVRQLLDGMYDNLSSDFQFVVKKVVEAGESYAFEWVLSGTNDRANPDAHLPATGKKFEIPGLTIGVRSGGLIMENRDYWNVAAYLTQVGLMPQPGQE
jgi:steroid delta-isomerase-like uncharacterized protein